MDNSFLPEIAVNAFAPSSGVQLEALPAIKVNPKQRKSRKAQSPAAAEAIRKQRSALQRHKQRPQFFFWEPLKNGTTRAATAPSLPGIVPDFVTSKNISSPAHRFPGAEPLTRPPGSAPKFEIQSAGRLGFSSSASSSSAKKTKGSRASRPVDWSEGWFEDGAGVGSSDNNPANSVERMSSGERRIGGGLPSGQKSHQQDFSSNSDEQLVHGRAGRMSNGFVGADAQGGDQQGTEIKDNAPQSEFESPLPSNNTASNQSSDFSPANAHERDSSTFDASRPQHEPDSSALSKSAGGCSLAHDNSIQQPSKPTLLTPLERNSSLSLDENASQLPKHQVLQPIETSQPNLDVLPSPEAQTSIQSEGKVSHFSERNALPQDDSGAFPRTDSGDVKDTLPLDKDTTLPLEANAALSSSNNATLLVNSETSRAREDCVLQPSESSSKSYSGGAFSMPSNPDNLKQAALHQSDAKGTPVAEFSASQPTPESSALPPLDSAASRSPDESISQSSEQKSLPLSVPNGLVSIENGLSPEADANARSKSEVDISAPTKSDSTLLLSSAEFIGSQLYDDKASPSIGSASLQASNSNALQASEPLDSPPSDSTGGSNALPSSERRSSSIYEHDKAATLEQEMSPTTEYNAPAQSNQMSEPGGSSSMQASMHDSSELLMKLGDSTLPETKPLSLSATDTPISVPSTGPDDLVKSELTSALVPSSTLPTSAASTIPPDAGVEPSSEPGVPQEPVRVNPGIEVPVDVSEEDAGSALQRELKKAQMERDRRREAAKEARARKRNRAMGRMTAAKALADGTAGGAADSISAGGDSAQPLDASNVTASPGLSEPLQPSILFSAPPPVNTVPSAVSSSLEPTPQADEARMDSSSSKSSAVVESSEGINLNASEIATADGTKASSEPRAADSSSVKASEGSRSPEGTERKATHGDVADGAEGRLDSFIDTSLVQAPAESQGPEGEFPAKATESAAAYGTKVSVDARIDSSSVEASTESQGLNGTMPLVTEGGVAPGTVDVESTDGAVVPSLTRSASTVDRAALAAAAALAAWTAAEAAANATPGDDENLIVTKMRSRSSSKGSFREREGSMANDSLERKSSVKSGSTGDETGNAVENSSSNMNASSLSDNALIGDTENSAVVESASTRATSTVVETSDSTNESTDPLVENQTTLDKTSTSAMEKEAVNGKSALPTAMGNMVDYNDGASATAEDTNVNYNTVATVAEIVANDENNFSAAVVESTSMVTDGSGASSAAVAGSVTRDDNTIESNAPPPRRRTRGERKGRERGQGRRREKDASTGSSDQPTATQNMLDTHSGSSAAFEVTSTTNHGISSPATAGERTTYDKYASATAESTVANSIDSSAQVAESTSMVTDGSGASSAAVAGSMTQDDNTIESSAPRKRRSRERVRRGASGQSPDVPADPRKTEREMERRAAHEASVDAGIAAAEQAVQKQRALKEAAQEEKRVKSPDEEAKARAKAERAAKRAEAKAKAAAEVASKDSAAAESAAAEQDWRQERQRQRSWHLSNAGSSFDSSYSLSHGNSFEESMSTSLDSAGGGDVILGGSKDNYGLLGNVSQGFDGNAAVNNSDSVASDNSPPALTHDEMVNFFFNSSADTSGNTFASVQKEQKTRGMRVDGFGAPIGGRPTMKVVRKAGGVREIVPVSPDGRDDYQPTFTNRFENQGRP